MEDGNSNVTPKVPLSDDAGVMNVAPTANETNAGPMYASTKTQEEAVPMLAPQEVDTLLLALSDYREHLRGYRSLLLSFLAANDLALAGTVIDFTAAMSAKEHLTQRDKQVSQ